MFLTPWVCSSQTGFAPGGNKFDLDKCNPDYFERLHRFMKKTIGPAAAVYGYLTKIISK